jgi:glutamate--cysteine ligase
LLSTAHIWLKQYPWLAQEGQRLALNLGVEKEGLRVTHQGLISKLPHPKALGSKLTHPSITTDYSEALLEFITPVLSSSTAVLETLEQLHRFTLDSVDHEWIWPASMPCRIERELDVLIADYGISNTGMLKHVYRHGLWHRYGRIMQCIAGVHFNFSLPDSFWQGVSETDLTDVRSDQYFSIIRNFRRYSWLLMYLFGASPCVDASF